MDRDTQTVGNRTVDTQIIGTADEIALLPGERRRRLARVTRGIGLAAAVLVGAGAISLGAGAGAASAEPAPSHSGWDGSRYWFVNDAGEWRWTRHYDVYQDRTGGDDTADDSSDQATTSSSGGDIEQGWDGSVYWFQNSSGAWRYTSHRDIYLSRISGSGNGGGSSTVADTPAASPSSDGDVESAVEFALAQLGKPFVMGGNGPNSYDCSGLIERSFRQAGISLPRIANDQYAATTPISSDKLQRGDLLFWSDTGSARGIHHAAIYLGNHQYVEAAHPGTNVRISRLNSGYFPTHIGRP